MEEQASYAAGVLARGAYKHEVFNLLRHKYGVSTRTCESIVARARQALRERTGREREELRADSHAFYESVKRDPAASLHEKMYAQRCVDELLGLKAPQEVRHSGEVGHRHQLELIETVVRTREEARAILSAPEGDSPLIS
jgi:hypothetical protein